MADEKFYEQKLTNALVDVLRTRQNALKFTQAVDRQTNLIGSISVKIERLIGVGGSEARTYINLYTGQFRPGKWMPHCIDPELKNLFAQLEAVTKEVHKYSWHTTTEAVKATQNTALVGQVTAEIKSVFGEAKAKEIAARAKAAAIKATGINF